MSELHFFDEGQDAPVPRAREAMAFAGVAVKPYPDGRRVKLAFALTPFQDRPSVDVSVTNAAGHEVASLSLIEAIDLEYDFTLHLRGPEPEGEHTVRLTMFYPEDDDAPTEQRQIVAEAAVTFIAAALA